nr:hypothetical protein [uncultured Roseococcus sp.]
MPRWILLLPLFLPACAGEPDREVEAARASLASQQASLAALIGRPSAPPRAPAPNRVPGRMAGSSRPSAAPHAASTLLGASPESVRAALGEPMLQRSEGPAQVWLYAGGGCQLDIVMYPSDAGPRVAHVQARAGGLAQRTETSCLRDLAGRGSSHQAPAPEAPPVELGA